MSDENRREIAVADFDDEVRTAERRKPVAVALRPVVAAAHARAGDAHDRAEHEVQARDDERRERETADGVHRIDPVSDGAATAASRASRAR